MSVRHQLATIIQNNIAHEEVYQQDPHTFVRIMANFGGREWEGIGFSARNTDKIEKPSPIDYALDAAISDLTNMAHKHSIALRSTGKGNSFESIIDQMVEKRDVNRAFNPHVIDRWKPKRGAKIARGRAVISIVKQIMLAHEFEWFNEDDLREFGK